MAGFSGRWLLAASLVGCLGGSSAAYAQAGRVWVDPPADFESKPRAPTTSASSPDTGALPAHASGAASSHPIQPSSAPPRQDVNETASIKALADAETKVAAEKQVKKQASSAAKTQRRERQASRRRDAKTQMSQANPRSAIERRARVARYGTVQEGLDAGLQVMRLRTIQLPDGRRIDVLTRPDQDIASGLPDGY